MVEKVVVVSDISTTERSIIDAGETTEWLNITMDVWIKLLKIMD